MSTSLSSLRSIRGLTSLRITAVLSLALTSLTGCFMGDDIYDAYVAKIGDSYFMYVPLCKNEHVDGVELYVASDSTEPSSEYYWKAEEPTNELTEKGWIKVGDNESFSDVELPSEQDYSTFESFTLTVWSDDPKQGFNKYGTEYGRQTEPREVTPKQARKESLCAGQYVA